MIFLLVLFLLLNITKRRWIPIEIDFGLDENRSQRPFFSWYFIFIFRWVFIIIFGSGWPRWSWFFIFIFIFGFGFTIFIIIIGWLRLFLFLGPNPLILFPEVVSSLSQNRRNRSRLYHELSHLVCFTIVHKTLFRFLLALDLSSNFVDTSCPITCLVYATIIYIVITHIHIHIAILLYLLLFLLLLLLYLLLWSFLFFIHFNKFNLFIIIHLQLLLLFII